MKDKDPLIITGGAFYGRVTEDGPLLPAGDFAGRPDGWICRRLVDYPNAEAPPGGAIAQCTDCHALIVYNPHPSKPVPPDTPKICMQCGGIEPLPYGT